MGRIVGMNVGDISFDIEIAFVDVIEFLFEVLVDEFVATEELVEARDGGALVVITVAIHYWFI